MTSRDSPWWTLSEAALLELLQRVHGGEHPDDVYAEFYANAEHHRPGDERAEP